MAFFSWTAALLVACSLAAGNARASGFETLEDGLSIYEKCQTDRDYCRGYVAGVADGRDERREALGWRSCPPDGATAETITDAVVRWMDAHPEARYFTGRGTVAQAMAESFPCS